MIRRTPRHDATLFATQLLRAMGYGAAAASALAACGGTAVVERDVGSGGAGGSGSATTTSVSTSGSSTVSTSIATGSATTGTGGGACDAPILAGTQRFFVCLFSEGGLCPDKDAPEVFDELTIALADEGCGGVNIQGIPCGPVQSGDQPCCYTADGVVLECGGRPFFVDGEALTAGVLDRADWRASLAPDVEQLSCDAREVLARAWTALALDEHASIASFARFVMELLAAGAPASLVADAQRAMADEIRHAELCFGLASAYAGRDLGPGELASGSSLGVRSGLVAITAAVVREGCVGETVAAFAASAAQVASSDAAVRQALTEITRDEATHAALAWRFVAWAVERGGAPVRVAAQRAFDEALAQVPTPRPAPDDNALRAHGQLGTAEQGALLRQAIEQVVRPCMLALLAPRDAAADARDAATDLA